MSNILICCLGNGLYCVLQLNLVFLVFKYVQNFIKTGCTDVHMHPLHASTSPTPLPPLLWEKPAWKTLKAELIDSCSLSLALLILHSIAFEKNSHRSVLLPHACMYKAELSNRLTSLSVCQPAIGNIGDFDTQQFHCKFLCQRNIYAYAPKQRLMQVYFIWIIPILRPQTLCIRMRPGHAHPSYHMHTQ